MNIDSVRMQMLSNLTGATRTSPLTSTQTSFENLVQTSLAQIAEAESAARTDTVKLATGSSDSLHSVTINAAKDLALQMMVSVRNKALDAYNEIMRITL